MKVKSLGHVRLLATPWTAAYKAHPSMRFSRQEYWSGVPLPTPPQTPRRKHKNKVPWQCSWQWFLGYDTKSMNNKCKYIHIHIYVWFANIFFHVVGCFSFFWWVPLLWRSLSVWCTSTCLFCFYCLCFWCHIHIYNKGCIIKLCKKLKTTQ